MLTPQQPIIDPGPYKSANPPYTATTLEENIRAVYAAQLASLPVGGSLFVTAAIKEGTDVYEISVAVVSADELNMPANPGWGDVAAMVQAANDSGPNPPGTAPNAVELVRFRAPFPELGWHRRTT